MKFLTFSVSSTQLTVKLKSSQMTTKSHTLAYSGLTQLTVKLKSSQMTTKSHTLAYSGLTSLYKRSVSVHNPLVELDDTQITHTRLQWSYPAHGKTEK